MSAINKKTSMSLRDKIRDYEKDYLYSIEQEKLQSPVISALKGARVSSEHSGGTATAISEWNASQSRHSTVPVANDSFNSVSSDESVPLIDRVNKVVTRELCVNPKLLDVRKKATWTDYILIVEGRNHRHLYNMATAVSRDLKHSLPMDPTTRGIRNYGGIELEEGRNTGSDWITLDLNSVVVHFMSSEARQRFDIEGMWESMEEVEPISAESEAGYAQNFVTNVLKDGIEARRQPENGEHTLAMFT